SADLDDLEGTGGTLITPARAALHRSALRCSCSLRIIVDSAPTARVSGGLIDLADPSQPVAPGDPVNVPNFGNVGIGSTSGSELIIILSSLGISEGNNSTKSLRDPSGSKTSKKPPTSGPDRGIRLALPFMPIA